MKRLASITLMCSVSIISGALGQALKGDNASEIARSFAPPIQQLNNLRSIMTVEAVQRLTPSIVSDPQSPSGQLLSWHGLTLNILAIDHVPVLDKNGAEIHYQQFGPHHSSYALAMTHIAMFEVANAYSRSPHRYTSWIEKYIPNALTAPPTSSSEPAAIVQAAYRMLVHLYPTFAGDLLIERNKALTLIGAGKDVDDGKAYGDMVSALVIGLRANDNSTNTDPRFGADFKPNRAIGSLGQWSPDPVSQIQTALGATWGQVPPFVLASADEFPLTGPPDLKSQKYKSAFDEVKKAGGDEKHNIVRNGPKDRLFMAKFWSYDGSSGICAPSRLYNQIADQILADHKEIAPDLADPLSKVGAAEIGRYYALINTALVDAGIAAWNEKYKHQFWRPVTGIRASEVVTPPLGGIGKPILSRSEVWYPLGAQTTNSTSGYNITPPFPSYPSGHAVFGSALFEVLRELISHDNGFDFQSDEFNGKHSLGPNIDVFNFERCRDGDVDPGFCTPTHFASLNEAEKSNSESRIWMGVHWRFDADDGEDLGRKIGQAVVARSFRRVVAPNQ